MPTNCTEAQCTCDCCKANNRKKDRHKNARLYKLADLLRIVENLRLNHTESNAVIAAATLNAAGYSDLACRALKYISLLDVVSPMLKVANLAIVDVGKIIVAVEALIVIGTDGVAILVLDWVVAVVESIEAVVAVLPGLIAIPTTAGTALATVNQVKDVISKGKEVVATANKPIDFTKEMISTYEAAYEDWAQHIEELQDVIICKMELTEICKEFEGVKATADTLERKRQDKFNKDFADLLL